MLSFLMIVCIVSETQTDRQDKFVIDIYMCIYICIWVVVDIVVACLVDCWLLGDCIGKNRNTSSGQDFRIYSLKIHLQDKDIVTLHGIYSKNID